MACMDCMATSFFRRIAVRVESAGSVTLAFFRIEPLADRLPLCNECIAFIEVFNEVGEACVLLYPARASGVL